MAKTQTREWALFLLRVSLGWLFFYAGLSKVLNPEWTAAGFLGNAGTLKPLYNWFAASSNIAWVDFINQWGLLLGGLGLATGTLTRLSAYGLMLMMALYYFPGLAFPTEAGAFPWPYVEHGLLVDEHIVYIFTLAAMVRFQAGQFWGVDSYLSKEFKLKGWWF